MQLPAREDLDAMCELIGGPGACFDALPIPDRMRVIELVNQCDQVTILYNLATDINIGFAETLAEQTGLKKIAEHLDDIDTRLSNVADWFNASKVYYP